MLNSNGNKLREDAVNLILIAFVERDLILLNQVLIGMKNQTEKCHVTIVYDHKTPEEELKILRDFKFDEYVMSPESMSSDPAARHKWAYDRSPFRYVAFQQGDDQPYLSRIEVQLRAMRTSTKKLGICLGGFHYVRNKNLAKIVRNYFTFTERHLFNVAYPSFWLLDKSLIPWLPEVKGFEVPNEWEWDFFVLIPILQQAESIVLQETVGIYNQHANNSTNTHVTDASKQARLNQLIQHFKTERPLLRNIYFINNNGIRTDNK